MERTTQGFHTFTISHGLAIKHAEGLLSDFKKYRKRTNEIRIRPDYYKNNMDPCGYHWIIEYTGQSKGLIWNMRICHSSKCENPCTIKATINPKLFAGISDYLTAANADYLAEVETRFNLETGKISPYHLGTFGCYSLTRIDYCLNIDVNELSLPCNSKQLITLIKRADVPPHYSEWTKYNERSHRKETNKNSFYLTSGSATVQLLLEIPATAF